MKRILIFLVLMIPLAALPQKNIFIGDVLDEKGEGLGYATVALLFPSDSTLAFFGITNTSGHFEIRNPKPDEYLMQIAYLGYQTLYRKLTLPLGEDNNFGAIIMKPTPITLKEVQINGEPIPLLIKKDTIEYNAAAFRTKPDAVAEDLLRKLPGLEVDRAGNVKALGEDVRNVLVDGKEFFGNDLKVATKNVPADAIKKVQVYDKKSDESAFTGISDGSHDKTVNLVLKDDKKKAVFGDIMSGGGTGDHYQGSAKLYRFTGATQFAALGMLNNINQFGFSFADYITFNGGIGSMNGGTARIGIISDNSFPVNFGQPVNGYVTSGAAGLNFSHEFRKNNRFYVSYLGNGSDIRLDQQIYSRNFIPGNSFIQQKSSTGDEENWAHRLSFGWKNRIDSSQNLVFSGAASLTNGSGSDRSTTGSTRNDSLINTLGSANSDRSNRITGNFSGSYIKKLNSENTNLKLSGNAAYSYGLNRAQWQNITQYYFPELIINSSQYQKTRNDLLNGEISLSLTQKLGKTLHLEPLVSVGYVGEAINREQGIPAEAVIDSLSPVFTGKYFNLKPGIRLKHNTEKTSFSLTAQVELGRMKNILTNQPDFQNDLWFFTPWVNWEYEYKKGRRIALAYQSSVNTPSANQLLPVVNNINPLMLAYGNRTLKPEYRHDASFNWWIFDQFTFTSLFSSVDFIYTHNKINWDRTINDSLGQTMTLVNVPDD
ncbi:MAG TPA: outer membrane beta-barrel protein, partial [Bacteroidales bacterium]|nr:outer membrane beta-barrel protein [Bacteroidales bacterium]